MITKRVWASVLMATMVLGFCACGKQKGEVTPAPGAEPTATATPTAEPTIAPLAEKDIVAIYQETLKCLLEEHIELDGYKYEDEEWESLGQIEFAVCDVDVDGEQELIIRHADTYMAGQYTAVYRYDAERGELVSEGGGTASCRFYTNGTMQDDLSHNQGYSRHFWPFIVYEYDSGTKEYEKINLVDAWELEYMKEAGLEEEYPAEADKEGAGFVYYFWEDKTTKMSQTEYDAWYDGIFGGAKEIEVDYQPLTLENIKRTCAKAAYERLLVGDISAFDPEDIDAWGLNEWKEIYLETGNLEYTYMDLDGDGVVELLVQWIDAPGNYNGVFDYTDGKLRCWQHDSVEAACWDYPLRDGTMVRQYDTGWITYTLFRYQEDGSKKEITSLCARAIEMGSGHYDYEVGGKEVNEGEFEKQLKRMVTTQLLGREKWTAVKEIEAEA